MSVKNKNRTLTGVYAIKNIVNNKIYVGSSGNMGNRWQQHLYSLRNGTHHSSDLQKDYDLYGFENFIFFVLKMVDSKENDKLSFFEQLYITKYNSVIEGYNMCNSFITEDNRFVDMISSFIENTLNRKEINNQIHKNIKIFNNEKMLYKSNAFTKTWYSKQTPKTFDGISKDIYNYRRNYIGCKGVKVSYYTTYFEYKDIIPKRKLFPKFIDYKKIPKDKRNILVYLMNNKLHPSVSSKLNTEQKNIYSVVSLLSWIQSVSMIDEEIYIYILNKDLKEGLEHILIKY